jgi:hypothetical protein
MFTHAAYKQEQGLDNVLETHAAFQKQQKLVFHMAYQIIAGFF